ncbi:hypothetical protein BSPWISOXPB_10532 [uncultured Gammaproteobacteria bacterium]|nr:hypothetical protein BSPWISOXPB_10532 [uncultured Gammaproteobacteria bacterium]
MVNRGLGGKTSIKLLTKSKAEQDKKIQNYFTLLKKKLTIVLYAKREMVLFQE